MIAKCKTHLTDAGENYFQHLRFAAAVGLMLIAAGLACVLHAFIPACCTKTASTTIARMNRLFVDRGELGSALGQVSGALTLVGLVALALPCTLLLLILGSEPLGAVAVGLLALAVPAVYLCTNPQLEPVA
jgi:hypothetical protein